MRSIFVYEGAEDLVRGFVLVEPAAPPLPPNVKLAGAIVIAPRVLVDEALEGFRDGLEGVFGPGGRVLIGMDLEGEFPVSATDVVGGGGAADAEDGVVVGLLLDVSDQRGGGGGGGGLI